MLCKFGTYQCYNGILSAGEWWKMMRYRFWGSFLFCSQSRTRIQKSGQVNPAPTSEASGFRARVNESTFLNSSSWLATIQKCAEKMISHHFASFTSRHVTLFNIKLHFEQYKSWDRPIFELSLKTQQREINGIFHHTMK